MWKTDMFKTSDRASCLIILFQLLQYYVKILKFGTPQTIAIIVLKVEKFDVTLH